MVKNNQLSADVIPKVKDALLRRHRHQHERRHGGDSKNRLPIIRSLADIGRNSSRSMFGSHSKFKNYFCIFYCCVFAMLYLTLQNKKKNI
ncbi:hypothetical protein BLA29_012593 [Euroglyphus maynei]|uniref:Uncharacterized protein n=1 Tax=Euroglyphus maynei TaxID=6958 RepID=A0A1Y3AS25_EURMA|nr:hypothetical protein BLA29_012593 [Euroglyphus maynei]